MRGIENFAGNVEIGIGQRLECLGPSEYISLMSFDM